MLKNKLVTGASSKMQNAFSDIQEKCAEIKKLERTVRETFEMMQELAIMVQHQGEVLDSVENNINLTKEYTGKGVVSLQAAKEQHQESKKVRHKVLTGQ